MVEYSRYYLMAEDPLRRGYPCCEEKQKNILKSALYHPEIRRSP